MLDIQRRVVTQGNSETYKVGELILYSYTFLVLCSGKIKDVLESRIISSLCLDGTYLLARVKFGSSTPIFFSS